MYHLKFFIWFIVVKESSMSLATAHLKRSLSIYATSKGAQKLIPF